jgi:hypothetical protein
MRLRYPRGDHSCMCLILLELTSLPGPYVFDSRVLVAKRLVFNCLVARLSDLMIFAHPADRHQ